MAVMILTTMCRCREENVSYSVW